MEVVSAFRSRHVTLTVLVSPCVVGLNWFLHIWAVSTGQILEANLGYCTNLLMSVLFDFLFLREQLPCLQGIAILLVCIDALLSFSGHNQFPWLALSLTFTSALYGFTRKMISVGALLGLFIKTTAPIPLSPDWILWLYWNGEGSFCSLTVREGSLLLLASPAVSLSPVTPAYTARHICLMTLDSPQHTSPIYTLFPGILMFGETLSPAMLMMSTFIWLALLLYTVESWRQMRHLSY